MTTRRLLTPEAELAEAGLTLREREESFAPDGRVFDVFNHKGEPVSVRLTYDDLFVFLNGLRAGRSA